LLPEPWLMGRALWATDPQTMRQIVGYHGFPEKMSASLLGQTTYLPLIKLLRDP